jgi:peptide/nickel transport system permease protein
MIRKTVNSKLFKHYLRDPSAVIGSIICLFMLAAAVFAPLIAPQNPYDLKSLSYRNCLKPPIWVKDGQAPFLLGTDEHGRGIFSTILYGLRVSLAVGFGVVILAGTIGSIIGLLAGFHRGWFGIVSMRLADTLFSFSTTLLAILILGITEKKGILTVILAITLADWVRYARITRGNVLSVAEEDYVLAAKSVGASDIRIIFRHILPNVISSIVIISAVDLAIVIMLEATLSFLGVGVPLTEPSLGMLIAQGREYLYAGKWWLIIFPGATLGTIVVGINLFADWLREELNPKLN